MIRPAPRLARRTLLRGAGGVALGLPLLDLMRPPRPARAQTSAPLGRNGQPRRLVVLFSGNGQGSGWWAPDALEAGVLAPLGPHRQDVLLLDGVDMSSTRNDANYKDWGHELGFNHVTTCASAVRAGGNATGYLAGGISLDQEVARQLALLGQRTRFPSLHFGVQTWNAATNTIAWRAAGQGVPHVNDPQKVFAALFSDPQAVATGGAAAAATALQRLREHRRSVLDAVKTEYQALARRLGAEDRSRLEAHLTSIREMEASLPGAAAAAPTGGACRVPERPAVADTQTSWRIGPDADFVALGRAQTALLAHALACDLTRVSTLMWRGPGDEVRMSWLGIATGAHTLSHGDSPERGKITRFYAGEIAALVARLRALPEAGGTVFDNTVLLWVSEHGTTSQHNKHRMPFLIVGSAGGALRTGRRVLFQAAPHGDLYVSLMNALGVPVRSFGKPEWSRGPLPGLAA